MVAIGEGNNIPKTVARRRSPLSRGWKRAAQSPRFRRFIGNLAGRYIQFVGATNRLIYEGAFDYATADVTRPLIIAMWHGQHILLPTVRRKDHAMVALISRHRDGDLNAIAAEKLGLETVRGSAARDPGRVVERGGISGFLKLRTALKEGKSVCLTADLSNTTARRAGSGIIHLARASGAPIVPLAMATSRRRTISSWDRTTINLPFGRKAMVVGEPISVPAGADDELVETLRIALEVELNRITERAYALADRTDG